METPAGWTSTDKGLVREFTFASFEQAIRFITAVAGLAERMNHHPEIWNSYDRVTLTLFTHDQEKVTEQDTALALEINAL